MPISNAARRLLDEIEKIEMMSLEWGFADGSLSEDEVLDLAERSCAAAAAEDVLEELLDSKLIFEFRVAGASERYRSRFAEMTRLLASLRQLFDRKPWQSAPRLVADFRIDRRPRRFPIRDRNPEDVLAEHALTLGRSQSRRELWRALTSARTGLLLSSFQERSAARLVSDPADGGTIVTAGTGSGKTLAFYLPALVRVGEAMGSDFWVKVLAVYPRIELLKDQFGEAYRIARALDGQLEAKNVRPVRLGAFFGATPQRPDVRSVEEKEWTRRGSDFVCPWLRCPVCDGEILWRSRDIEASREELHCANVGCPGQVPSTRVALTRESIQRRPPDILFTTTEILNQRMSDHWTRSIFGIGVPPAKKPFLALLDEVHTYEGTSGAQVALTLRRWRHLLGAPVMWAGLSATLSEAPRFFADLTGANADDVVEITPSPDEMEEQGAEYQLMLRGDPASRASLLSTTIQTSMLVGRTLDPPQRPVSQGLFGARTFLFTDDLDVTNRLFDDIRDSEAYDIWGRPRPNRLPLANLRAGGADAALRDVEGQRWRMCEEIGHPLDRRLVIGRTTSQDAGVDTRSNVIVATSTLEVGYNDPDVGAVIQHKAPRAMASFLQRKGRAGRRVSMRPITITVLSDYGRDRALYQAYEHLFDPSLEVQHLPIGNQYVLKMQAVYCLMDWLASKTSGPQRAWIWDLLSRPLQTKNASTAQVLDKVRDLLIDLSQAKPGTVADLRSFIGGALKLDEAALDDVLWRAPRSLLLEAIPTIVRRLFRDWKIAFPEGTERRDFQTDYHPLPDFIPRNLFSDLSLPEVHISLPAASVRLDERTETMPILQALKQLAPGRVTRRFAFERAGLSHWVPVDPALPEQDILVSDFAEEHEYIGSFKANCNDLSGEQELRVYRPWSVRMQTTPKNIMPTSNAQLVWQSELSTDGDPLVVPVPPRSAWSTYVRTVSFHLHRFRSSITVRRFASEAHANIRTRDDEFQTVARFRDEQGPAALGYELEVDGFFMELSLPSIDELVRTTLPGLLAANTWLAFLKDLFRTDDLLPRDLNEFQRDWLFQILHSALCAESAVTGRSLSETAVDLLAEDRLQALMHDAMSELFGAAPPQADPSDDATDQEGLDGDELADEDGTGHATGHGSSRLQRALSDQLARSEVRDRLRALAARFDDRSDDGYGRWLRNTIAHTLAEALLQACMASAPRHAAVDDLLVDVQEDRNTGAWRIWVTESTLGGAGVVQAFADRFSAEPRIFFNALEASLAATDLELVDDGLRRVIALAGRDAEVIERLARLRGAEGHREFERQWREFSGILVRRGMTDLGHALTVSLTSRLLRAGGSPALDALLARLLEHWDRTEARTGIALGLREFSYVCAKDPAITAEIKAFLGRLPGQGAARVSVIAAVTNLLWPRAGEVRLRSLRSYNPYRGTKTTDPALVRSLLMSAAVTEVDLADNDWNARLEDALERFGTVKLVADSSLSAEFRAALIMLLVTPVDVGFLQFFPAVDRVERLEGKMSATLVLREQV